MRTTGGWISSDEADMDIIINVERIRKRWQARFDEEPDSWVTVNGNHIPLDEDKDPIGGQLKAFGDKYNELKEKTDKWYKEHPFDPFEALMVGAGEAEDKRPDYVKEFERMEAEKDRRETEEYREKQREEAEKNKKEQQKFPYSKERLYSANKYASKIGYNMIDKSMLENFSDEDIRSIVDKVDDVYKEFGIDKSDRQFVFGLRGSSGQKVKDFFGDEDFIVGGSYDPVGGEIFISPNYREQYRKDNPHLGTKAWDIVYHESTHGIDSFLSDAIGVEPHVGASKKIVKEAVDKIMKRDPSSTRDGLFSSVSFYAGDTTDKLNEHIYPEVLAESVRRHMNGDDNEMTKEVVDTLKGYIKRYLS